jgi:hypothetical protein
VSIASGEDRQLVGRGGRLQKLVLIEEAVSRTLPSANNGRPLAKIELVREERGQASSEPAASKCPQQAACSDNKEVSWLGAAQMRNPLMNPCIGVGGA